MTALKIGAVIGVFWFVMFAISSLTSQANCLEDGTCNLSENVEVYDNLRTHSLTSG